MLVTLGIFSMPIGFTYHGNIIIILGLHQMEIFHFKKLEVQKAFTFKKSEANRYWSAFYSVLPLALVGRPVLVLF